MAQGFEGASLRTVSDSNVTLAKTLCRHILKIDQKLDTSIIGTPGSSAQDCIKVICGTATYIVKVPRKHTFAGREAARSEARWARWASDLGVSPRVLFVDEETGGFVMDFINGQTLTIHQISASLDRIVNVLHEIHRQEPQSWMGVCRDPAACVAELIQDVQDRDCLETIHAESLKHAVSISKAALAHLDFEAVPCHNDFHGENMLLDQRNKIWCVDFECAGLGDPMWDLAFLAVHVDKVNLKQLAQIYGATEEQRARLNLFYCLSLTQAIVWFAMNGPSGIEIRDAYLQRLEDYLTQCKRCCVDQSVCKYNGA